jgi:hypothetical protein
LPPISRSNHHRDDMSDRKFPYRYVSLREASRSPQKYFACEEWEEACEGFPITNFFPWESLRTH